MRPKKSERTRVPRKTAKDASRSLLQLRKHGARNLFRPLALFRLTTTHPRLAPLRQAQGRLWAAFSRRFGWRRTLFEISTGIAALKRRATHNLGPLTFTPATRPRRVFLSSRC